MSNAPADGAAQDAEEAIDAPYAWRPGPARPNKTGCAWARRSGGSAKVDDGAKKGTMGEIVEPPSLLAQGERSHWHPG